MNNSNNIKIKLIMTTQTMGDCNTMDDNARYAAKVELALRNEYPNYDVDVSLVSDTGCDQCYATDDFDGSIKENVMSIMNDVWAEADY